MSLKKQLFFPLLFGIIGVLIGLFLRYAFTGSIAGFSFKNFLHAHSHLLLLGFIFNALIVFVWNKFTRGMDAISNYYFLALQVCMAVMTTTFILQGYAFHSILFSTLHLWISYILLIRLWKRLQGDSNLILCIKTGIIFHFFASLGPYALGPLMVFEMKSSPWYQQAIFFYLHFEFFGVYFVWMLALLFEKITLKLSGIFVPVLSSSLVLGFAHSLDYSFDHWLINAFGGIGAICLFALLLRVKSDFLHVAMRYKMVYFSILFVSLLNIAGSFPRIADLAVDSRFVLIAWLHLIFLGMYVPFIWVFLNLKMNSFVWPSYGTTVILTELILIFPAEISTLLNLSIMWLLFLAYLLVVICFLYVHLCLLSNFKKESQFRL